MGASNLTNVMDLLLDAVCVVDPEGRLVSVSGACERIFGYTPDEMIGRPILDLVFHEDLPKTLQAVDRIMGGYLQHDFENRYVRKDGQLVHIQWSARWSEVDKVRVAVARDITRRRQDGAALEVPARWRLSGSPPSLVPPGFAPIPLSAQDYTVLLALATGGECVTRQAIVAALGKSFVDYDQRRLDTQMRRLRRKVEEACGLPLPVATLRSVGYRFYDSIEVCK
ncbi:MAG TPA: PAS domain S-box protein [Rhodocyclaceae bacterium]|nr:PAS domain S-box protein [Rhodocyclaceae bacterium]